MECKTAQRLRTASPDRSNGFASCIPVAVFAVACRSPMAPSAALGIRLPCNPAIMFSTASQWQWRRQIQRVQREEASPARRSRLLSSAAGGGRLHNEVHYKGFARVALNDVAGLCHNGFAAPRRCPHCRLTDPRDCSLNDEQKIHGIGLRCNLDSGPCRALSPHLVELVELVGP
jgi:hypothetical protein